jgi:hypothetical protein
MDADKQTLRTPRSFHNFAARSKYGTANMYSPLNDSKKSGGSGEYVTHIGVHGEMRAPRSLRSPSA